jgi:hypothetical protein
LNLEEGLQTLRFVFLCLQPRKEGAFVSGEGNRIQKGQKLKAQTGSIIYMNVRASPAVLSM